ncbi:RNA polymerase sigma-70 factor [Rubrolithibacter danxiaensis]|uniref:RNA polymerase sigma-70 factor n=1 Tax=Rubrolithibacter danxiaensis TaxID=3390805 RepID=UPI003BF8EA04
MSDLALYSEKELLKRVAAGSEQGFEELFNCYHQRLGAYIFRLTDSMEMAEELVQDVFLKLWLNRETLTGVENFKAFLFTVSKNHTLNCLKKIVRERMLQKEWEENNNENEVFSEELSTSLYLLEEAIDRLPPQQKTVYLLSRHERLKYAEIASRLQLSKETVKSYLKIATHSIIEYVQSNLKKTALLLIFLLFS